jgi:hypothetical protein
VNVDTLFFMLGWDRYGFYKKHVGTCYAELVFLHPVRSAGHVMHSAHLGRATSEHYFSCSSSYGTYSTKSTTGRGILNLCFCIQWDLRAWRAFYMSGAQNVDALFFSLVGPVWIPQKAHWDTLHQTFVIASGGFCV